MPLDKIALASAPNGSSAGEGEHWIDALTPLGRVSGAHSANAAHAYLRGLVLDGTIPPGAELNQVDLAIRLGLSRTPVREAIRMLQKEGLVDAEPWKRATVVGFDAADLEAIYVQRILQEGFALAFTVPLMTESDLAELQQIIECLSHLEQDDDGKAWKDMHNRLHQAFIAGVSERYRRAIEDNIERSEHYRTRYQYRGPRTRLLNGGEHENIVKLCIQRDASGAAAELAAHLARTALTLIGQLAPQYDPRAIRLALERSGRSARS